MKYTFTRKQIVNAFNNKILDDDNFLTYLLSTTSKDIPMNQKLLDKKKAKELECNCIMSGYAQTTNFCPVHKNLSMKPKELEWDRFVKENHTNFSKDANGIKYEFYEDDLLEFITQQRTELLEEILNLECLKEEKITKNIFSITQLESRNKLRNEIKNEIKKL